MMLKRRKQHSGEPDVVAPQGLAEDIVALYEADVAVPPEVDEAVVAMARQRFAARERFAERERPARRAVVIPFRPAYRWATAGVLAAAAVLALVVLPEWLGRSAGRARIETAQETVREDVDGSGEVDILDAFMVAREIESDAAPRPEWDMNGDGAVDGADVDEIALAAVSLERSALQ